MSELTDLVTKQNKESYQLGKKHGAIEELEKVKLEIQDLFTTSVCGATPYYNAIQVDEILNKHIEKLEREVKAKNNGTQI